MGQSGSPVHTRLCHECCSRTTHSQGAATPYFSVFVMWCHQGLPAPHLVVEYAPSQEPLRVELGKAALAVSTDAVRKRIARGSLESDGPNGFVPVWLDEDGTEAGREVQVDGGALLEAKDETIRVLREQFVSLTALVARSNG